MMDQKTIFITGAAAGIGRETALLFAQKGWFIGLYDIDEAGLEALKAEIGEENCITGLLDVRDEKQAKAAFETFGARTAGRLDVLFNNAGIIAAGRFDEVPLEQHRAVIEINVWGTLNCTYHALGMLRQTPDARIINMSSASALYGHPYLVSYAASKMAVRSITEGFSLGLREIGIKASDVMPMWVTTGLAEKASKEGQLMKMNSVSLTPPLIAKKVWKAAHRNKPHWLAGFDTRVYYLLDRIAPKPLAHFFARFIMRRKG